VITFEIISQSPVARKVNGSLNREIAAWSAFAKLFNDKSVNSTQATKHFRYTFRAVYPVSCAALEGDKG
jgi:hypothetical protein